MKSSTSLPEAFHVRPPSLGHRCTMIYNRRGKCANFGEIRNQIICLFSVKMSCHGKTSVFVFSAEYRRHIHGLFLLPADRPLFRRINAVAFDSDSGGGGSGRKGPLTDVHKGLKNESGETQGWRS